jgi:hypothetical protein
MGMIGFIAAALSLNCSECHDTSSTAVFCLGQPRQLRRNARGDLLFGAIAATLWEKQRDLR